MKDGFKVAAICVGGFIGLAALGFATNAVNLASLKFWGPQYENARRDIEQQSIRRQEGVNEGIAALCLNMRTEKDVESKKAFANLIIVQASATGTNLTPATDACVAEANTAINL